MPTTLTQIPERFATGSTVEWTRGWTDYPSDDGWTLTYGLSNGTAHKAVVATADGAGGYELVLEAADNNLAPGTWYWQEWATKGTDKIALQSGKSEVVPDLLTAAGDARTGPEIVLEKILALISGSTDENVVNFTIGDRALSRYSLTELIELQKFYQGLVARQSRRVVERVVF